jgi:hypothetical protein
VNAGRTNALFLAICATSLVGMDLSCLGGATWMSLLALAP